MADRTLLTDGERADLATRLPDWELAGDQLRRTFTFASFVEAWAFMAEVAVIAEDLRHHPDWSNSWNRVDMAITTHRLSGTDGANGAGGLTHLDVAFAEAVDRLLEP